MKKLNLDIDTEKEINNFISDIISEQSFKNASPKDRATMIIKKAYKEKRITLNQYLRYKRLINKGKVIAE